MKIKLLFKGISLFIMTLFLNSFLLAQEKVLDVSVKTEKTTTNWYAQPWVWIVAGAVFILLLVALLKNNSKSNG